MGPTDFKNLHELGSPAYFLAILIHLISSLSSHSASFFLAEMWQTKERKILPLPLFFGSNSSYWKWVPVKMEDTSKFPGTWGSNEHEP